MARKKSSKKKPVEALPADIGCENSESRESGRLFPQQNSLQRALDLLTDDQIEEVVLEALSTSGSGGQRSARQSLDAAINACPGINVKGFPRASKAKAVQLQEQVLNECISEENSRLLGKVLRMWMASRQELRDRVESHLNNIGVKAESVDFKKAEFTSLWELQDWNQQIESLLEAGGRLTDRARDDSPGGPDGESGAVSGETRLMLGLVSGAVPALPGEIAAMDIGSWILRDLFENLWSTPTKDLVWLELRQAIEALQEIDEQKSQEMVDQLVNERNEQIDHLSSNFREELAYLECDLAPILELTAKPVLLLAVVEDYCGELINLLERYREILPRASSLSEDRSRRKARASLEEEVLAHFEQWQRELKEQEKIIRERLEAAQQTEAETVEAEAGASSASEGSRDEELDSLRDKLREEKSAHKALQGRYDKQGKEMRKWARQSSKLEQDKQRLEQEIESLRALQGPQADSAKPQDVSGAREEAGEYRVNYPPDRIKDVKDAFSQSQRTYSEELVFAPNSRSEHSNSAFEKPDEVFKALAWLAFEFRDSKLNPGIGENLNEVLEESLKKAVRPNWSYTPRQSMTAVGKYPDAYRTTYQGNKYDLHEHLKRGRSYDPKSNIRISFAWDEAIRKVVVGYIGRHQKTAQS